MRLGSFAPNSRHSNEFTSIPKAAAHSRGAGSTGCLINGSEIPEAGLSGLNE
jgi:hypothetical protein